MTYTVQPGETLKSIAREVLGDESLVTYLASINNIKGYPGIAGGWFYKILPGQVIETGVAEVTADPWPFPTGLLIGVIAAGAGVYYHKEIISFIKKLV